MLKDNWNLSHTKFPEAVEEIMKEVFKGYFISREIQGISEVHRLIELRVGTENNFREKQGLENFLIPSR